MPAPVYIAGCGVISAAGAGLAANWQALQRGRTCLAWHDGRWRGGVSPAAEDTLHRWKGTKLFSKADRVALLAAAAVAQLEARLPQDRSDMAVIAGSARGATALLEREHASFLRHGKTTAAASPRSTAGTLAALISRFTGSAGLNLTLSASCVSGMHALGNALLYLRGGGGTGALCVASEAPLTPFVFQMLKEARVLSAAASTAVLPMRPFHPYRDGLVLAEGAAALYLQCAPTASGVRVAGYGAARDRGVSLTGVSHEGEGLVRAAQRALQDAGLAATDIDLVIGHGSATQQGDCAEWRCFERIFTTHRPPLRCDKWCIGHTLGSSTLLSTAFAFEHLCRDATFPFPYQPAAVHPAVCVAPRRLCRVLVWGMGFGGNCAALVLVK